MKPRFFITATGTDIGKTFVTAALAHQAKTLGRSIMVYKPVGSGFDPAAPEDSDTGFLLRALGLPLTLENIGMISPWRYRAALAPSMAAKLEGQSLDFDALLKWSLQATHGPEDIVMIEGVGGVMTPLDGRHTVLDWIEKTGIPVLLVSGSYLGTISHTLTALAALEHRKIHPRTVIVNESENASVSLDATVQELARWTKATVIPVTRRNGADSWQYVEELKSLLIP